MCNRYPQSIAGRIFSTISGTRILQKQSLRYLQLNALTTVKEKVLCFVLFFLPMVTEIPKITQLYRTLFPNENLCFSMSNEHIYRKYSLLKIYLLFLRPTIQLLSTCKFVSKLFYAFIEGLMLIYVVY